MQGATLRKFAIAHPDRRDEQWRDLFPLLCNTLWGGEDVLLHCISGRHRAAGTACMFRAILLRERFEAAWDYLASVRDVDIQGLLRDRALAGWIHETLRTIPVWAMPGPGQPATSLPPAASCASRATRTHPFAPTAKVARRARDAWYCQPSAPRRWKRLPGAGLHARFVPIGHRLPGSLEEAVAPVFILSHSDT